MKNFLFLGFFLSMVWISSASAKEISPAPFTFEVRDNGDVIVSDGFQEIARVFPWVFTGKWVHHHWQGSFLFISRNDTKNIAGSCAVTVNQVPVELKYQIECLENGLRIHYQLEPLENLKVSAVEVYCRFPYTDWQGCPFDFNNEKGFIPIDAWKEKNPENAWLIRQADSASLSIGPSRYHGGLTAQVNPENLYVLFADDRWYDPKLSIVLNHNDAPGYGSNPPPNWSWEKGQEKDFNFTLTFSRPMACQPSPSPNRLSPKKETPSPTFTASFTATFTPTDQPRPFPIPSSTPTPRLKAIPTFDFAFLTPNFFTSPTPTPARQPIQIPILTPTPTALSSPILPKPFPVQKPFNTPPISPPPTDNSRFLKNLLASQSSSSPAPSSQIPAPLITSSSTPTPVWLPLLDKQQNVEFMDPPANIYVVFADGPGRYRAEIMDRSGKTLKIVLDRKIVSESDMWIEWDCMDNKGMPVPPGQYFVVIYKDGEPLKSLSVVRVAKDRK